MTGRRRRRDDASPSGIGDVLGAARRGMGLTLEHAATETHLRESYLAALERDDIEHLGLDPAYVRGTLRTYADHLGLDADALVARHRAVTASAETPVSNGSAPVADDPRTSRSTLRLIGGVAGLTVVAVVGFTLGETLALHMTAPVAPVASHAAAASDGPRRTAAVLSRSTAAPTQVPAPPLELELTFVKRTWVRVETDGRVAREGRARRRSVEEFDAAATITVRVAEPSAVRPTFNGVRYAMLARNRDGPVKFTCDADDGCEVVE